MTDGQSILVVYCSLAYRIAGKEKRTDDDPLVTLFILELIGGLMGLQARFYLRDG